MAAPSMLRIKSSTSQIPTLKTSCNSSTAIITHAVSRKKLFAFFKRLSSIGRSTPYGKNRARLPNRFTQNGTSTR